MDPLQSAQIANTVNQEPPVPPQPPMAPQPANPIEPPKQKNSSIIFILSLTTIVACLIAAFFYWQNTKLIKETTNIETPTPTPTPDITVNWKTYTNTKYGYELKYPNNWFSDNCNSDNGLLLSPSGGIECATEPYYPIQFGVNINMKTINNYVNSLPNGGFKATLQNGELNGFTKYIVEKTGVAPGPDKFINFIIPAKLGIFSITVYDLQQETVADQIISTFNFLEATPSASPTATPSSSL